MCFALDVRLPLGVLSVQPASKLKRGFALLPREALQAVSSKGGRRAHEVGTAHEFSAEEAAQAGKIGGLTTQRKKARNAMTNTYTPPVSARCELCNRSAYGFAVFEGDFDGAKAILPIGWRCFSHRIIPFSQEKWKKAAEEFQKRDPEKRRPKTVQAGTSNLSEEEVRVLYQLMSGSAVSRSQRDVEVAFVPNGVVIPKGGYQ